MQFSAPFHHNDAWRRAVNNFSVELHSRTCKWKDTTPSTTPPTGAQWVVWNYSFVVLHNTFSVKKNIVQNVGSASVLKGEGLEVLSWATNSWESRRGTLAGSVILIHSHVIQVYTLLRRLKEDPWVGT